MFFTSESEVKKSQTAVVESPTVENLFTAPFVPVKRRWEQQQECTLNETDFSVDTSQIVDDDSDDDECLAAKINALKKKQNSNSTSSAAVESVRGLIGGGLQKRLQIQPGFDNSNIMVKKEKQTNSAVDNFLVDHLIRESNDAPAYSTATVVKCEQNSLITTHFEISFPQMEPTPSFDSSIIKKRGRPRKSLIPETLSNRAGRDQDLNQAREKEPMTEAQNGSSPSKTDQSLSSSPAGVEKKRKRKLAKNHSSENFVDDRKDAQASTSPSATKTRNRGQGNACDFNPRMLLMCRREQLYSDEPLTVPEHAAGTGELQCGLCLARTTRGNWLNHIAEHYGIGWIVGESSAVDLTSRNSVLSKVQAFFRHSGISKLSCRLCQRSYRSYLGVILHLENCGEAPQRVDCPLCGNNYTKLSMVVHQRSCTGPKQTVNETETNVNETETENSRKKRVSSIKAKKKLKILTQDLCQMPSVFEPKKFVKRLKCANSEEQQQKFTFVCTICGDRKQFDSRSTAIKHVLNLHRPETSTEQAALVIDVESDGSEYEFEDALNLDESEDDTSRPASNGVGSESTTSSKKIKNRTPVQKSTTVGNKIYSSRCPDVAALTKQLWREFVNGNYVETGLLFENFSPKVEIVNFSDDTLERLLPSDSGSMKFTSPRTIKMFSKFGDSVSGTLEWKSLLRFQDLTEPAFDNIVYVGAPIKFLLWVPLPPEIHEQYLVLAYRRSSKASAHARLLNAIPEETLLLVYKIKTNDTGIQSEIHYAFYIPDGPIHTFSFLPSGGYDIAKNRLCLIAIGSVQNSIRVYAMPIEPPVDSEKESDPLLSNQSTSNIRVIRLSIAFELVLNLEALNDQVETQCLNICWSEFLGHEHIFASFTNGYIAVWKIQEPRPGALNTYYYELENGQRCYTPQNYFSFEEGRVYGLTIHYDTCGPRWILAFSSSRNLCVFDIRDKNQPITVKEECMKHVPRCIDWSPIWEPFYVGTCDIMPNYGRVLSVYNHLGVGFFHLNLAHSLGGISEAHYNPWQNTTVFATDNGDLCCVETTELNLDWKKAKRALAFSMLDMKRIDSDQLHEVKDGEIPKEHNVSFPIIDKSSKEQENLYGIVFSTFAQHPGNETTILRDEKRKPPSNMERLMRVNRVRWNLNATAQHLLAIGYENGFLRLCRFNRDTYFK